MINDQLDIGDRGEAIAEKFLLDNGYAVIARNYTTKGGEVDFIAVENDEICFVEVKTRTGIEMGRPEEAVTFSKKRRIARAAKSFIFEKDLYAKSCRFDVIAILLPDNSEPAIEHFKNAFRLDEIRMKLY